VPCISQRGTHLVRRPTPAQSIWSGDESYNDRSPV
jgi:hypothetical protein